MVRLILLLLLWATCVFPLRDPTHGTEQQEGNNTAETKGQLELRLAREQAKDFCDNENRVRDPGVEGRIYQRQLQFQGSSFRMYLYSSGDIVSTKIPQEGWDLTQLGHIHNAFIRYMQKHHIVNHNELTFLDIGAHIGWYSMTMATKGFRVVAFEPMKDNAYIIHKTICLNPTLDVTLVNVGLGEKEIECTLYSEDANIGDTGLVCREGKDTAHYKPRGRIRLHRLDDYADALVNVTVVKMDVEGFEHHIVKGGKKILLERHIPYIQSEYAPHMLIYTDSDPKQYLQDFANAGYKMSMTSFFDNFVSPATIEASSTNNRIIDVFFTHSSAL